MYETITNAATGIQPRTGNWATRGTVAARAGHRPGWAHPGRPCVLWVVFATAVALAALGIGLPAIPVTVRAIRRLETRVRHLVGNWCGTAIGDPYQPEPARREGQPPSFWARFAASSALVPRRWAHSVP